MPRYDWIIFDADGTLFDYDRAELTALKKTFRQYGLGFDAAVHRRFMEINSRLWLDFERGAISSLRLRVQRFEELAKTIGAEMCASDFSVDYLKNLGARHDLIPGAEDLLERVSIDSELVLATNGIAEVQRRRFSASSLAVFFSALVISDEIGAAKPAPEFFSKLFSMIGCPEKAGVLMVGDGLSSDIKGGADFGIDTCWFNPSREKNETPVEPTYEINDLAELLHITCD